MVYVLGTDQPGISPISLLSYKMESSENVDVQAVKSLNRDFIFSYIKLKT